MLGRQRGKSGRPPRSQDLQMTGRRGTRPRRRGNEGRGKELGSWAIASEGSFLARPVTWFR